MVEAATPGLATRASSGIISPSRIEQRDRDPLFHDPYIRYLSLPLFKLPSARGGQLDSIVEKTSSFHCPRRMGTDCRCFHSDRLNFDDASGSTRSSHSPFESLRIDRRTGQVSKSVKRYFRESFLPAYEQHVITTSYTTRNRIILERGR